MMMFKNPGCVFVAASLLCLLHPGVCAQSKERANKVRRQLEREVQGKPAALQSPQEQQRQDPIQKLISDLETGDYGGDYKAPARKAYYELSKLGVLVLPVIHKRLLDLNPFGIRAALELAVEYPTPELYRNLKLMLEDRDLGKQILAARVLYRLPPDRVREHVELAGKSPHPVVRLGALHARVKAGADVKPILAEIKPLLRRREKDVSNGAVTVLCAIQDPRARKVLKEVLMTWDGDLWAARQWVSMTGPKDEAAALTLYKRLQNKEARAALVKFVLLMRPDWLRLQARGVEALAADGARSGQPIDNQAAIAQVFERLSRESTTPAPSKAVLKELLRKERGGSGWAATFVLTRPRKPEWVPLVEQAMFMHELSGSYFQRAFAWMEQAAPERLLARASELLDGPSTDGISRLLAERGDVSHVPLAVRWFRTHGGLSRSGLVYLIREKSDRTSLPVLVRLAQLPCPIAHAAQEAANEALNRWFSRQDIPVALDAIWTVNASFAHAILENVRRVATRADVPRIVRLMSVAAERLREWERSPNMNPSDAPSPTGMVTSTVSLLGKLGGQDAADNLLPLLEHRIREVRERAVRTLLWMKDTDRKKVLCRLLTGKDKRDWLSMVLEHPLAGTEKEVRSLLEKRLVELPDGLRQLDVSTSYYLNGLPREDRRAMALRILAGRKERRPVDHDPALAALQVLGDQEDAAKFIPQFGQWVRCPQFELRHMAVVQLGRTYSPRAVPYLLEALKDETSSVRSEATQILDRFETYRNQVERYGKLATTEWPEPVKPKSEKKK